MTSPLKSIIDNTDGNTVLEALRRLLPEAKNLDVATGYFEIGALLALDSYWNSLDGIRVVMGDETTKRTYKELVAAINSSNRDSIEREKEKDDSLTGLAAVREALSNGLIQARVYTHSRFHAKSYLMEMKSPHLSNYGIVGSSNFTEPGISKNVELNVLSTDPNTLAPLREWFESYWGKSEELKQELLKTIEPHLKERMPFEVYVRAMFEYFMGKEVPTSSWEENESRIYPILDPLQRDGYRQALWIAENWGGALVCDGVGFGKTYIGLMLIERFLHERKRVALIVPKSARESVWENRIKRYLSSHYGGAFSGDLIEVINHTDLPRENFETHLASIRERADVVIVDEAHHFRTPNSQRSAKLFDLVEWKGKKKKIFLFTATPINNNLFDILHLIEYFSRKDRAYFKSKGINDTRNYFVAKEKVVEAKMKVKDANGDDDQETLFPDYDVAEAEKILKDDLLFRTVVIQRSRDFAKNYFKRAGNDQFYFPERMPPVVADYKLAKVYGDLFGTIKKSFSKEKPFVDLSIYNPESYRKGVQEKKAVNREKQLIILIRSTLLKRMESSYKAFESSLEDLMRKNARFVHHYAKDEWERWKKDHQEFWDRVEQHWKDRYTDGTEEEEEVEEDDILPPMDEHLEEKEFFIGDMVKSARKDLDELSDFLQFIHKNLGDKTDDKLNRLLDLLESDPDLRTKKVIIFTQYRDTARYLYRNLKDKIKGVVEELDSTSKKQRETVLKRFAPYYNCTDEELPEYLGNQIRVLISTDVLSEGLNLQDANLLINYDLHWNPVRLMQRIGRVDRRLDPQIEDKLGRKNCRVRFWNFLPPDDLDELLKLYSKVSGKLLKISKTLGIEGKQLLKPEDDYEALKDFNASYEGTLSFEEKMRLVYEEIMKKHPELRETLLDLPKRLFSGRKYERGQIKGVFAAYRFPERSLQDGAGNTVVTTGECKWYFHSIESDAVSEDLQAIHEIVKCDETTRRVVLTDKKDLRKSLKVIEQRKVNAELRNMQALAGEKATLVCWMEVS